MEDQDGRRMGVVEEAVEAKRPRRSQELAQISDAVKLSCLNKKTYVGTYKEKTVQQDIHTTNAHLQTVFSLSLPSSQPEL